ncbi:MAG: hypothetical protein RL596_2675 [Bacteroidota bacterium]
MLSFFTIAIVSAENGNFVFFPHFKTILMAIPVVDLADFTRGNAAQKAAFVQALGKAYEEVGFVAVKNHGVPDELIAE